MEEAKAVVVSLALVLNYNTELGTQGSFRVGSLFPGTPRSRVVPVPPMSIPLQLGVKATEAGTNAAASNLAVLVLSLFRRWKGGEKGRGAWHSSFPSLECHLALGCNTRG